MKNEKEGERRGKKGKSGEEEKLEGNKEKGRAG